MPIIKSAKKRAKISKNATSRNARTKRAFRNAIKSFSASLKTGKKTGEELRKAQSAIDTAVKKGVIHKNKGARKKSQLAKSAKASGVKPKPITKKSVNKKKPAPKKA